MPDRDLYPPIAAYDSGFLQVSDLHSIYWEVSGNPKGVPAVFLHGGPGGGSSADHRRFFDPDRYRVLLFDQRGAGRSQPLGETRENTTQDLIADIEALRRLTGVERWLVFGGSWGSTLALAYAEAHPERVSALVLRGIFLGRQVELDWWLKGLRLVFPDAWETFTGYLPEAERDDPLSGYHRLLMDPDPSIHLPAARCWAQYEAACSTLLPSPQTLQAFSRDQVALALARLEAHYFINGVFMEEAQLLTQADRITAIPGVIVQGRYDMICPMISAHALAQAWPAGDLQIVADAGHSAMEPGTRRRLVAACDRFASVD
ncbi:MAG: prolyl aminopeptidase [Pseudomonadota bacterium]